MAEVALLERQGAVARLTLNRPEALNAYDDALVARLTACVAEVRADRDVRALVITGAGRAFCVGADLKALRPLLGPGGLNAEGRGVVRQLHALVRAVAELPLPVVAAVNGACAGGGLGLALACDFVWASEGASFAAAFSAIALTPDTGTSFLLTQAVGVRTARELFLTNRRVKADEALQLGLVSRVLPPEALAGACDELAARLAAGPTDVLGRTKEMVAASVRRTLAEQLELEVESALDCIGSADMAEGVAAFLEKRSPRFAGRR